MHPVDHPLRETHGTTLRLSHLPGPTRSRAASALLDPVPKAASHIGKSSIYLDTSRASPVGKRAGHARSCTVEPPGDPSSPSSATPCGTMRIVIDEPVTFPSAAVQGLLHHVELWVPDLDRAVDSFGWLLQSLGYSPFQRWEAGMSWRCGDTYIVVERSPAMTGAQHVRTLPGLNHLAFHAGTREAVERLAHDAIGHGWKLMYPDRHPFAGGPEHYAAYLENADGFEVELVGEALVGT